MMCSARPSRPGVWCWALLVLVMCPHQPAAQTPPAAAAAAQDNSTTVVKAALSQPVVLQSMFNVQINRVVFQTRNFTLVPAAWQYVSAETPYVLDRNFTISSEANPPTVMDWSFITKKVVMVPDTRFLFNRLVLLNTRGLRTLYFSWFLNSPGAVLTIQDSIMIDPVCNATDWREDLRSAQSLPQLQGQPRNAVTPAQPFCMDLPTGAECFQHGVHMQMLTVVLGSASRAEIEIATSQAQAAAAAAAGHFIIQYRNTTRVCMQYLDMQCLQETGGNRTLCWERALKEQQQQEDGSNAGPAAADGTAPATSTIAGAIAGVVGGLLVLLAATLLGRRWYRRRAAGGSSGGSNGGGKAEVLLSGSRPSGGGPQGPSLGQGGDLEGGSVRGLDPSTRGLLSGRYSIGEPPRPSFGRDGLHLGVLLGAGSFGRVYKGRWHGRDVAIKVVHCSPEEVPRVLREAEIMLQVDHPNVVRALTCILPNTSGAPKAPAQPLGPTSGSADGTGSSSAGGGSSRRPSTTTSISQMLPILKQQHGSGGSGGGRRPREGLAAAGGASSQAGAAAGQAAVDSSDSSTPAGLTLSRSPGGAAVDHQPSKHQQQVQQQQQHVQTAVAPEQQGQAAAAAQQSGVHVLTVATTGSDLGRTPGSTGVLEPPQQQRQYIGTEDEGQEDDDGREAVAEVWLVLELCTGGNLQDSFRQHRDGFDMARLLCRLAEVAQGMAHLHSKQIMHGDLKAVNVLLVNSVHGSFGQIAKLTDFGLAGVLRNGVTHHTTQHLGTITHCAPEILQDGRLSPAADVYAFGIMMWELHTSTTAFKDLHYGTIIQRVVLGGQRPPIPPDTPEDYALLMESCWAPNPTERPAFDQVLQCLTIMLHNLDAVTATTNINTVSPRTSLEGAGSGAAAVSSAAGQPGPLVSAAAAATAAAAAVGVAAPAAVASPKGVAESPFKSSSSSSSQPGSGSSNTGSFNMCSRTVSISSSQVGASSSTAAASAATAAAAGGGGHSRQLQTSSSFGTSSSSVALSRVQPSASLGTSSSTAWLSRLQVMSSMGSGDVGSSPAAAAAVAAAQGGLAVGSPSLRGHEGLIQYVRKGQPVAQAAAGAGAAGTPSTAAAAAGGGGIISAAGPAPVPESPKSPLRYTVGVPTQVQGGTNNTMMQQQSRRRSSEGSNNTSWVGRAYIAHDATGPLDQQQQQQQRGLAPLGNKAAAAGGDGRGPAGSSSAAAAAAARRASTGNMYSPAAGMAGLAATAAGGGPGGASQQQQQHEQQSAASNASSGGAKGGSKLSQLKTPESRHIQDLW